MLRTLTLAYSWENHLTQCQENKVLNISSHSLNTVLRVKNRMAAGVQNVCQCSGCRPASRQRGWLGAAARCRHPASGERTYCISLAGLKIQIWNSMYGFYWRGITFAPLQSQKILKSSHWKSETICIHEYFAKVLVEKSSEIIEPSQHIQNRRHVINKIICTTAASTISALQKTIYFIQNISSCIKVVHLNSIICISTYFIEFENIIWCYRFINPP